MVILYLLEIFCKHINEFDTMMDEYFISQRPPGDGGDIVACAQRIWTAAYDIAVVRGSAVIVKKGFQMAGIFGAGVFGPFDLDGIERLRLFDDEIDISPDWF